MIHILIVSHGNLAETLVNIANQITPTKSYLSLDYMGFDFSFTHEECASLIKDKMEAIASDRVIILTDMFGGNPSNHTMPFLKQGEVEVITGVNLPMLLYLFSQKHEKKTFEELCDGIKKAGQNSILITGELLS